MHDFILNQFEVLWDEYDADRKAIPPGDLAEVSYEELEADPVGTVRRIYAELNLDGGAPRAFDERMRARVEAATVGKRQQGQGYVKNRHAPLPAELREIVSKRWAAYTKAWGYKW